MAEKLSTSLLYLNNVSVSFDGFKALNALSLAVEAGEMRAIIGPNGAGKTTMMDVVTGKTRPDEGDVFFEGNIDLTRHDEAEIAELGIGRKFQKPTVFDFHTISNNLELALKGERGVFATLFHRSSAREAARIEDILDTIRLSTFAQQPRGQLEPWAEAVAGDRHAACAGPEAFARRRAGGRHDRRRDGGDGEAPEAHRRDAFGHRR